MAESTAFPSESILTLRRTYAAQPHRVFQAWVDINDLARWFTPDPEWPAIVRDLDVREGGGFTASFGDPREPTWDERVQYRVIDPPRRIEMLGHMTREGVHVAITRSEVTFENQGGQTQLTLIERGAAPESLDDRASGWGGTLDNLGRLLG